MADEMTNEIEAFVSKYEKWQTMTKEQQETERAVKHAREQRATAIVARILKVLEDEDLTVEDAHRILTAATYTVLTPLREMKSHVKTLVPGKSEDAADWCSNALPTFGYR